MSSGNEFLSRRCSRRRPHLHVTSGAVLRLRGSGRISLHLCVVSDINCEILQLGTIYLDPREPCSRLLHDSCLFLGILSHMREAEGAAVPPILGRVVTVPATSPAVLARILARPRPRPEAWLPRPLPCTPCALPAMLPPCEFPFELKPPLLFLLFDELLFPFEVLPPFPRRPRPYPLSALPAELACPSVYDRVKRIGRDCLNHHHSWRLRLNSAWHGMRWLDWRHHRSLRRRCHLPASSKQHGLEGTVVLVGKGF